MVTHSVYDRQMHKYFTVQFTHDIQVYLIYYESEYETAEG